MRLHQLEHVLRASATIADDNDIVVVGSAAILATVPAAPDVMLASVEADVYPRNHPERAELIDGSIGEMSPFHATFGYYAHGVGVETAVLPAGWEQRLVPLRGEGTRGATGWCLEVHDLVVSKLVAGRAKDLAYAAAAREANLLVDSVLVASAAALTADTAVVDAVRGRVERLIR